MGERAEQAIESARTAIRAAARVIVLTGAGISAESGVPTFRGEGGLWKRYRAEDLASPAAFARDPELVWSWYAHRREVVTGCLPNAAHRALAAYPGHGRGSLAIVTQNVDGLHRLAAEELPASTRPELVELHGDLFAMRCTGCDWRESGPFATINLAGGLPSCDRCGALARPDIVWFGEALDSRCLDRATDLAAEAEVCLVVGTSAVVQPAASLATQAHAAGAVLIEVNPEVTPLSPLAIRCPGPAATVVPKLLARESSRAR
jgi:NAD-dependent deacetylase